MLRTGLLAWILASVPLSLLLADMIHSSHDVDARLDLLTRPLVDLRASGS